MDLNFIRDERLAVNSDQAMHHNKWCALAACEPQLTCEHLSLRAICVIRLTISLPGMYSVVSQTQLSLKDHDFAGNVST